MVTAAQRLNGSDFNGDGVGDFAVCWQLAPCIDGQTAIGQILASMTQTHGHNTGWLFHPDTLEPFVGTPAMVRTLELVQHLLSFSWTAKTCEVFEPHMFDGTCAISIKWDEQVRLRMQW